MRNKEPLKIWCKTCLRWQVHDPARCPLFPEVGGIKKWSKCVCTVHTCYDAKARGIKRDKRSAPTYVDFVADE